MYEAPRHPSLDAEPRSNIWISERSRILMFEGWNFPGLVLTITFELN